MHQGTLMRACTQCRQFTCMRAHAWSEQREHTRAGAQAAPSACSLGCMRSPVCSCTQARSPGRPHAHAMCSLPFVCTFLGMECARLEGTRSSMHILGHPCVCSSVRAPWCVYCCARAQEVRTCQGCVRTPRYVIHSFERYMLLGVRFAASKHMLLDARPQMRSPRREHLVFLFQLIVIFFQFVIFFSTCR